MADDIVSLSGEGLKFGRSPANGELLIGNGSGFNLSTLTGGSNVTITNSSGGISISSTSGTTSVTATAPITSSGGTTPNIALTTPLAVSYGGTGISSVGTSGNVLTSNGTAWVSSRASPIPTTQVFPSNGTFTIPAGVTKVRVTVVGGGGGGGNPGTTYSGGGGGGTAIKTITGLTPGGTVTVTVGTGGGATGNGVTSSFGAYCSATGGTFAVSSTAGTGGIGSSGDLNIGGQAGTVDYDGYSTGGSSFLGGGGGYAANGRQYGGGGGAGASGADGVVVVEY